MKPWYSTAEINTLSDHEDESIAMYVAKSVEERSIRKGQLQHHQFTRETILSIHSNFCLGSLSIANAEIAQWDNHAGVRRGMCFGRSTAVRLVMLVRLRNESSSSEGSHNHNLRGQISYTHHVRQTLAKTSLASIHMTNTIFGSCAGE